VHVLTVEDLGDDPALWREPPVPVAKALQEVADGGILLGRHWTARPARDRACLRFSR